MVKATYTAQLIVLETPGVAGEVRAWATKINCTISEILRPAFFLAGWPVLRAELIEKHGDLTERERQAGVLASLPLEERAGYAARYGLPYEPPKPRRVKPKRRAARAVSAAE